VGIAAGFEAICAFVNEDLSAITLNHLMNIHVRRVPAYSPYAVAEFTIGMILTLNRKTALRNIAETILTNLEDYVAGRTLPNEIKAILQEGVLILASDHLKIDSKLSFLNDSVIEHSLKGGFCPSRRDISGLD
jgi:hypothetical protein